MRSRNLGKLRRRRKAFERGREHGVGVGGASGRLIKLRQREPGAQPERTRFLPLRDSYGGEECFFGGRCIRRIVL